MSSLAYFQQRLALAQGASELPASARFDLAFSDMDDDTLEQTAGMFGGPEYGSGGFGMTDVLNEFLSRDPKFVKVNDLSQYQQNLKDMGYLHPTYPVTGAWDDLSNSASRRAERDATDLIRSGAHLGSVTVQKGLGYLAAAVPQAIFQGVWGAVKGTGHSIADVATNPIQTVEEAGLAGGAATGAIVGAVAGGPVGAVVGGAIGGLIGLTADFFGDDEGEEGQSLGENLWDSLSPWDEYKQSGAKHFFSLLDTVMIASTALKAGTIGVKGVQAALKAPSLTAGSLAPQVVGARTAGGMVLPQIAEQSTKTVAQAGFREAFKRAAPGMASPGLVAKMTAGALKRPVIGGAALGGTIGAAPDLLAGEWSEALEHGLVGAGVGAATLTGVSKAAPKKLGRAIEMLNAAPLARITESGAGQVLRAGYTSLAVASTGARITADITPGEDNIEKAIKEAPDWGRTGDVIDLTIGTLLYPSRILPLRPREIGDAFRAMDNYHALMPFYRAEAQINKVKIDDDLIRQVDTALGLGDPSDRVTVATNAYRMYLDKAFDSEAHRLAQMELGTQTTDSILGKFRFASKQREVRARLVKQALDESADGPSEFASRLLEDSLNSPLQMQNEVVTWQGRGTSVSNLAEETQAQGLLDGLAPEGARRVMPALRDQFLTSQRVTGMRERYEQATEAFRQARTLVKNNGDNPLLVDQEHDAYLALDEVINEMRGFDLIDDADNISLRQFGDDITVDSKLVKRLDEIADLQPKENVELSNALEQAGLSRYIAVNTGENMLVTADIPRLLTYEGIDQVTRYPVREFFASMARKPDDYFDLGPMRYWSIASQLEQVSIKHGLGLDGKQMADRLYDFTRQRSDPEWAKKHLGEVLSTGKTGMFVRRTEATTGRVRKEVLKMDPRDLSAEDVNKAFKLDQLDVDDPFQVASDIKHGAAVGAAWGADMMHPLKTLRGLGRGMQIEGLAAFQGYARTAHVPLGKWTGVHDKKFDEMTGFSSKVAKSSWNYVPENLRRWHLTFQFTLSPSFDISRYLESMSFGARHGISPRAVINPRKYIRNAKEGFIDPLSGERVFGVDALKAMDRFADHAIYGRNSMQSLDDLQFRAHNSGIAGFKPREVESAQALMLAQRYAKRGSLSASDLDELRETLLTINRYGKGQSAYAKSAHFIFFPFLFQAKQLNLIQDVTLGAPSRVALMHEGFRRWYGIDGDKGLKEKFGEEVVEKHLPILKELARWNNLSYGIGSGRFFLDGLLDTTSVDGRAALDRSTHGKITQGLTQFFLPGGIHTPVGESFGSLMDAAKHLFMPVVIYDDAEKVSAFDEFRGVLDRAVPAFRDAQRWVDQNRGVLWEQGAALFDPSHMTGQAQFGEYLDNRSLLKQTFEQVAVAAGYSSWDSLRNSDAGAELADLYQQGQDLLRGEYPRGAELAAQFVDTDESKKVALVAIGNKESRTDAEEAILQLGLLEEQIKDLAGAKGVSQETMLKTMAPAIRQFALSQASDRQFLNLWENLGWSSFYGPLRLPVAA